MFAPYLSPLRVFEGCPAFIIFFKGDDTREVFKYQFKKRIILGIFFAISPEVLVIRREKNLIFTQLYLTILIKLSFSKCIRKCQKCRYVSYL